MYLCIILQSTRRSYCILEKYLIDIFQEYLRENGIPVDEDSNKGKKIKSLNIYILSLIYIVLVFDYYNTQFV